MYVDEHGRFFVNAMHPDEDNYKATIGVINGVDWNNLPDVVPELEASSQPGDVWHGIRTGYGEYQVLLQTGDTLSDGRLAGGIYSVYDEQQILLSQKPDFNAFIPTNQEGTSGFLTLPGKIDLLELPNRDSVESYIESVGCPQQSDVESTSINGGWVLCFGTVSPWVLHCFQKNCISMILKIGTIRTTAIIVTNSVLRPILETIQILTIMVSSSKWKKLTQTIPS